MKKALTILVLATASSLACAQAIPGKLVGPWYVGVSGGQSRADLDDWDYYNGFSVGGLPFTGLVTKNDDTRDSAWRIFLGYNFNQNWAVEGAYADLGRIKARYAATATGVPLFDITGDQVAWSAAVKGTLPVSSQFDVFALLGATSNRTKVTFTEINARFVGGVPSGSDHRTGLMTGLGAEFKPSPNVGIRFEYQNYDQFGGSGQSLNDTPRMTVDAWLMGVNAKF